MPKNFDGILRIVYEEKCGSIYDKIDGVKTLTFPENGILVLNEDFDRNVNYNYYLVDESGNRTKILEIFNFEDKIQKRPCVLFSRSGTIGQTIEANNANQEQKGITYSDFYVYNNDTVDRNNLKDQQRFDSLTTSIVYQCRQHK